MDFNKQNHMLTVIVSYPTEAKFRRDLFHINVRLTVFYFYLPYLGRNYLDVWGILQEMDFHPPLMVQKRS
jgi:hypothetical protein